MFRVRHHGSIARIEIAEEEFDRLFQHRDEVIAGIKEAGYVYVSVDLSGFRSGSMNDVLSTR